MNQEQIARIRLFAAIEGGSQFWSERILRYGCERVLSEIETGKLSEDAPRKEKIKERLGRQNIEALLSAVEKSQSYFLFPDDEDWPIQVNDLASPPIALLAKGERTALVALQKSLAIVGSRNPTSYGIRVASDFAFGAVDHEWSIISGGAYGIDSTAHKSALLNDGITCAVLASGFSQGYPAGNLGLFEEICDSGLLISEVMPSVRAEPFRFLTRNRLIAALSQGTIVVEAAYRSGSLRTAREAAEIFRHVLAVPGPITSPASEGCHRLIAERSAELVTSISDVFEVVTALNVK